MTHPNSPYYQSYPSAPPASPYVDPGDYDATRPAMPLPGQATAGPPNPSGPPPSVEPLLPDTGTMGLRLGARMIDTLIFVVAAIVLGLIAGLLTAGAESAIPVVLLWLILIPAPTVYELVFVAKKGWTLGKLALGLRVVRETDGALISAKMAFTRIFWLFFLPYVFPIVWFSPFLDRSGRRQGFQDIAAHSRVVKQR